MNYSRLILPTVAAPNLAQMQIDVSKRSIWSSGGYSDSRSHSLTTDGDPAFAPKAKTRGGLSSIRQGSIACRRLSALGIYRYFSSFFGLRNRSKRPGFVTRRAA